MKSIEEMVETLKGIELTFDEIAPIIEFLESLEEEVIFCQKCQRLRLDPGVEMTMTYGNGEEKSKKLEMCGPCLKEFFGEVGPQASEVEYELEDGTTIKELGQSGLFTIHGPDEGEEHLALKVSDRDPIRYLEKNLRDGILNRASDIHFEPLENSFAVRYRIDGELRDLHERMDQNFGLPLSET